jgi:hypothetical protein
MATEQDYGPWIIGGAAFLLLAKFAIDQVPNIPMPNIPNPFPAVKRATIATIETTDELTGGIQGDPTSPAYWYSADIPWVEQDIPLIPGLIKDPDESWQQYLFGFDVPGGDPISPVGLIKKVF